MAAKKGGLLQLSPEMRTRLAEMATDLEKLEKAVVSLKKIKVDTTQMEERLLFMKETRQVLLEEFD